MAKLYYMTDEYLAQMKDEFDTKWIGLYRNGSAIEIRRELETAQALKPSHIDYEYIPLELEPSEYNPKVTQQNLRNVWQSLGHLTSVEAEQEKVWLGLLHSDYLDYHLAKMGDIQNANNKEEAIESSMKSNTIFNNGAKRSLVVNHLSTYWWIVYYLYDEHNEKNPFHLADFFVSVPYRGNSVGFFSSSFIVNKQLALGIVEGVKFLVNQGRVKLTRKTYTESNKLLNQIGGLRILDMMSREEVRELIIDELPNMDVTVVDIAEKDVNLYSKIGSF